jgi:hypothetical protein
MKEARKERKKGNNSDSDEEGSPGMKEEGGIKPRKQASRERGVGIKEGKGESESDEEGGEERMRRQRTLMQTAADASHPNFPNTHATQNRKRKSPPRPTNPRTRRKRIREEEGEEHTSTTMSHRRARAP